MWTEQDISRYQDIYTLIQNLGLVDGLHLDLVAGALGRDGPAPGVRAELVWLLALNFDRHRVPGE